MALTFTKRKTIPSKTDKRYILSSKGGLYNGIAGKPQWFSGSNLANCVGYCFSRRQEIEEELTGNDHTLIGIPKGRKEYKPTSAYLWYGIGTDVDGYERSKKVPKEGSVIVWKNNNKTSGHVAFIEDIADDGKSWLRITESGYNSYLWRSVMIYPTYCLITSYNSKNGKYTTSKHYNYKFKNGVVTKTDNTFLGYIYPPKGVAESTAFKVGDKVVLKSKGYKRTVIKVDESKDKPYLIGVNASRLTGWYKAEDLELQ